MLENCTAINWLYYQKTETIVVIFLHPVDGYHARFCYYPNFWLYKPWSNTTRFEFLFAYCVQLYGFLRQYELYGFWVSPTLWSLIRFYPGISFCGWYIPYLYFSLTYIFPTHYYELMLLLLLILVTCPLVLPELWGGGVPTSVIDHYGPRLRRLLLRTLI